MLSLAHTLSSLPFAFYLEHPVLIFLAAAMMHFVADTLLHWNIYPDQFKRYPFELVALDIIAGVVLAWLLIPDAFWSLSVWAAIAGGNAPDVLHGLWDFAGSRQQRSWLRRLTPFFTWHDRLQRETTSLSRGLVSQVLLVTIAIALVWRQLS